MKEDDKERESKMSSDGESCGLSYCPLGGIYPPKVMRGLEYKVSGVGLPERHTRSGLDETEPFARIAHP